MEDRRSKTSGLVRKEVKVEEEEEEERECGAEIKKKKERRDTLQQEIKNKAATMEKQRKQAMET